MLDNRNHQASAKAPEEGAQFISLKSEHFPSSRPTSEEVLANLRRTMDPMIDFITPDNLLRSVFAKHDVRVCVHTNPLRNEFLEEVMETHTSMKAVFKLLAADASPEEPRGLFSRIRTMYAQHRIRVLANKYVEQRIFDALNILEKSGYIVSRFETRSSGMIVPFRTQPALCTTTYELTAKGKAFRSKLLTIPH